MAFGSFHLAYLPSGLKLIVANDRISFLYFRLGIFDFVEMPHFLQSLIDKFFVGSVCWLQWTVLHRIRKWKLSDHSFQYPGLGHIGNFVILLSIFFLILRLFHTAFHKDCANSLCTNSM